MIEIRFHGRGGQGVVTAARLLAEAAFAEEKYAQAFPFFGAERRGAPVLAFTRIDRKPINVRTQVYTPDHVVVLDRTIPNSVNVAAGLKANGTIVLNNTFAPETLKRYRVALVNATKIATECLGAPITNTAMLGAVAKVCGVISLDSLRKPMEKRFGRLGEKNFMCAKRAHEEVVMA
ncbi:MAG: pyruvate ferredoxin oxidoreductase subunit gamma [Candidatus Hadarchaeales archaeon]